MATTANARFTAEDRRHQILDTAMDLFGRQGYLGTTTRQISEAAGVNEAIIFRHFPTKEDLYWEVLDRKIRQEQGCVRVLERMRDASAPREVFVAIGRDFLERRAKDPSMMRLLLFTALENHELSSRFFHTYITDVYERLADYIREQIDAGRFRPVDPLLAARGFLGMFVYHFMVQELFGARKYQELDIVEVSETLTDIWLRGMAIEDQPTTAANSRGTKHSKTRNHTAGHATSASGNGHK